MAIIENTTPPYIEDMIFEIDALHHKENGYYLSETNPTEFAKIVGIHFAKLHVKAALEEASENVCMKSMDTGFAVTTKIELCIDKDSILNSYPLDLIK
jgi:neutral trehalase